MKSEFPEKFAEFCQGVVALFALGGFSYTLYSFLADSPNSYAWYELLFIAFLWLIPWAIVIGILSFFVKAVALPFSAILITLIDLARIRKQTN